jgi:hypothetical protein
MIEKSMHVLGACTFWTIGEQTLRPVLQAGLKGAGFGTFTPEQRPAAGALRDALTQVLGGPTVLIRRLEDRDGFAVVEERRGQDANDYQHTLTARINDDTLQIRFSPFDERAARVVAAFNTHLGMLKPAQVSTALVAILDSLGGTRLRPTGAIYWLPEHRLDEWQRVAQAVERAAAGRPSAVYLLRNQMDADAVRAVRDAIVAEVQQEAERIQKEVASAELGERALENRRTQAGELRQKIALYEELLGVGLHGLEQAVDAAEQSVAMATLLIAAQPPEEVANAG